MLPIGRDVVFFIWMLVSQVRPLVQTHQYEHLPLGTPHFITPRVSTPSSPLLLRRLGPPSSPVTWAHSLPTQSSFPLWPSVPTESLPSLFLRMDYHHSAHLKWYLFFNHPCPSHCTHLFMSPSPHHVLKWSPLTMSAVVFSCFHH